MQIEVVAAIIINEDKIYCTQRKGGKFDGKWEFPGGKIEKNESLKEALKREIKEELNVEILIKNKLCTINYNYPDFHIQLHCFISQLISEDIELKVHKEGKWMKINEIDSLDWLPADWEIISLLKTSYL